jgi:hypothetical protein
MAKSPRSKKSSAKKPAAKASNQGRKAPSKAPKAPTGIKPKPDRRGCPKGRGTSQGGAGAKSSGAKPKGKIGNPPFEPTDDQRVTVKAMVAGGSQQWVIAHYLGISEDTLQRHFRLELDHGKLLVDGKVGGSIAQKALEGDAEMSKFYMRTRGGWSEKHRIAHGGDPEAPPIAHEVSPAWDLSGLSRAELKEMKRLAQKAKASAPSAD